MELDEFVQKTIEQVISGVANAGEHARVNGARIAGKSWRQIEFDLAVTTTKGNESQKGGTIAVWDIIGVKGQNKAETTSSTVSRVKFSVLVLMPKSSK
jgi:hypothetical protein